jgi:hypothetical protein
MIAMREKSGDEIAGMARQDHATLPFLVARTFFAIPLRDPSSRSLRKFSAISALKRLLFARPGKAQEAGAGFGAFH